MKSEILVTIRKKDISDSFIQCGKDNFTKGGPRILLKILGLLLWGMKKPKYSPFLSVCKY